MKQAYLFTALMAMLTEIIKENASRLSADFVSNFSNKKVRPRNFTAILRKQIVVGNTTQLLDSETKRVSGVSDYQGTRLKTGTARLVSGIRIAYGQDDLEGKEGLVNYNTAAPAAVRNGKLIIAQDGTDIIEASLSEVMNNTASSTQENYWDLDSAVVLTDGQDLEFRLEFPKGAKPHASKKEYFEVATRGIELVRATL